MESKSLPELKGLIADLTQDLRQLKAAFTALKAFTSVKHGAVNGHAVAMSYREFTSAITATRKRLDRIAHVSGVLPGDPVATALGAPGAESTNNDDVPF